MDIGQEKPLNKLGIITMKNNNLEEIKTLQVIQLKYSKRIVCEVADD